MILLYNPPSSPSRKPVLPMSLLALAAALRERVEYEMLDGNLCEDTLAELTERIERSRIRLLAVTIMPGPQLTSATPDCRALKARFPELTIVWGGYFPTMHPEAVLADGCVDYVLRGHAEEAFAEFAVALCRGEVRHDAAGLGWVEEGTPRLNPMGPLPDLDALPLYPWDRLPMERYPRDTFLGSRTLSHHTSYGCPFKCNFCAVVNMVDGGYGTESPERTERALEQLVHAYGANAIEFHDNNFFVDEARILELCDRIERFDIRWWAYGRIDTLMHFSDHTFARMRDSGLAMVFMGAESGSPEVLKLMNKGGVLTPDKTLEIAARMRAFDIVPELCFVLGNPPDPERDIDNTFEFVRRIKEVNPVAEIILFLYSPVPLTGELTNAATRSGFRFPGTLDEWISADWEEFSQHRTAKVPWLTRDYRDRIRDFQKVLHATYPTVTDPGLTGIKRGLLRLAGAWRYRLRFYRNPLELRALDRLIRYQRPEISGF